RSAAGRPVRRAVGESVTDTDLSGLPARAAERDGRAFRRWWGRAAGGLSSLHPGRAGDRPSPADTETGATRGRGRDRACLGPLLGPDLPLGQPRTSAGGPSPAGRREDREAGSPHGLGLAGGDVPVVAECMAAARPDPAPG